MNEYSIWLIPAEPWLGELRKIIERVAKENNTFSFEPHITILVKNDEGGKMIKISEELAKQITKATARLTEIAYENTYFRALYIKAQKQQLFQIHAIARKLAGMLADPSEPTPLGVKNTYVPHLSLLYGNLDEKTKRNIIKDLDIKLPMEVEFDKIELWRTGAQRTDASGVNQPAVDKWEKVVEISCQK